MKYQVAIIGGGPAGYTAAETAGRAGLSVILFEKQDLSEVIRRYENHSEEKAQMPCWPTLFDTMDF